MLLDLISYRKVMAITDTIFNCNCIFFGSFICFFFLSWAVSTVMTRQNAIPLSNNNSEKAENGNEAAKDEQPSENATTPALIPLWDLANHLDGTVTTNYNVSNAQVEGATINDIKKGEQIFIHYGNRNNANLLVHNG